MLFIYVITEKLENIIALNLNAIKQQTNLPPVKRHTFAMLTFHIRFLWTDLTCEMLVDLSR